MIQRRNRNPVKYLKQNTFAKIIVAVINEVLNSQVTKSSYEIELFEMTSHLDLLTRKFLPKFFFRVTNCKTLNFTLSY